MKHHGLKISAIVTGLLVIAAGILLFLFNTGVLNQECKPLVFSWQMLLIAIGFNGLFSRHSWFGSLILMMVGAFFLLPKLNIPGGAFLTDNMWTILLVFAGLLILFHAIFKRNCFCFHSEKFGNKEGRHHGRCKSGKRGHDMNEVGYIDYNNVFGGTKEKLNMEVFRGGDINCVFGGVELDFYDCQLAEGVSILEINTVFGGTVLYVPKEWDVEIRKNQVFGAFEDHRPKPDSEIDKSRTLIIQASSVFGGGEIKCKD